MVKLFETEAETTENKYTADEEFALNSFLKNVKQESDGRYTVSPLFKQNFIPIKKLLPCQKEIQNFKTNDWW